MKAGKQLIVRGTSSRGTATTDTYSLAGFSAALAAIDKACGNSSKRLLGFDRSPHLFGEG